MTASLPVLDVTPGGKWPDSTPIGPAQDGKRIVLVAQWDRLSVASLYKTWGQRVMFVVAHNPKTGTDVAVGYIFLLQRTRIGRTRYDDRHVWVEERRSARHRMRFDVLRKAGTSHLSGTDQVREVLAMAATDWLEVPSLDDPVRAWWGTYTVDGAEFDLNRSEHWTQLNNHVTDLLAQPCDSTGPLGNLAIVRGRSDHNKLAPTFRTAITAMDTAHPPIMVDGYYSVHLVCQNGRCLDQLSGEMVVPTRCASVDEAGMLCEILAAGGHTLEVLWRDWKRSNRQTFDLNSGPVSGWAVEEIAKAETTLEQILAAN